jgi:ribosome-binding factor A
MNEPASAPSTNTSSFQPRYPMPSHRLQRVRELLKRAIGEVLRREFPASEAGLLSVNDVDVTGDLKSATVFLSILGTPDQQKRGLALVAQHRVRLQGLVGRAVVLKYTPALRFVMDDSVARGNRVLQIIEELEKSQPAEPAAHLPDREAPPENH